MKHPAMDHHYRLSFRDENDLDRVYNSWLIKQPEMFHLDVAYSVESFNRRFPGLRCYLMWFNPLYRRWEEITLGSPVASKYDLFSED